MIVTLRPSTPDDLGWLVELRAGVMRADLERLGRYDPERVRRRLRDAYDPTVTRVLVVDGRDVGSIALRPDGPVLHLEHFYLVPDLQGRGIGGRVLRDVLADTSSEVRLTVLQGSPARRLYERHGFVAHDEDPVDVFMVRRAVG